jgi:aryl-alcohol dehydrogenase-like predicted oxidoreductase
MDEMEYTYLGDTGLEVSRLCLGTMNFGDWGVDDHEHCVDLCQIHRWDDDTPIEETLSALDHLVDEGKVRYIGASTMAGS